MKRLCVGFGAGGASLHQEGSQLLGLDRLFDSIDLVIVDADHLLLLDDEHLSVVLVNQFSTPHSDVQAGSQALFYYARIKLKRLYPALLPS